MKLRDKLAYLAVERMLVEGQHGAEEMARRAWEFADTIIAERDKDKPMPALRLIRGVWHPVAAASHLDCTQVALQRDNNGFCTFCPSGAALRSDTVDFMLPDADGWFLSNYEIKFSRDYDHRIRVILRDGTNVLGLGWHWDWSECRQGTIVKFRPA